MRHMGNHPGAASTGPEEPQERTAKQVHPSWGRKPIWTLKRQLMGNLVPGLLAAPFAAYGVFEMWRSGDLLGRGLAALVAAAVVGWIALNFLGLYQNRAIHREMEMRLRSERPRPPYRRYFVGMATPAFRGWLDPHEDVGYLMLYPDRIEFFGERHRVVIEREKIVDIRVRPNVHTLVGLGRWVSVEATVDGKPARLLIEIRQRNTLLGNLRMSRTLLKKLRKWLAEPS